MTKYIVSVREVHINHVEIEADNPEQAVDLVNSDRSLGDELLLEYSHDLDKDFWGVYEAEKEPNA